MSELRKLSQRELSDALGISESQVASSVADNSPMPDGSGHWVSFSLSADNGLLSRLEVGVDYRLALDKSWLARHS